ncbi:MAG: diguanylate cyclase [Deltaproteobacteria bacterium]|nr:diguanylate cyclase [Deltaproteobacteria bacterium]
MSMKMKAFIDITIFFLMIAVSAFIVQRSVVFNSFIKIEHDEIAENVRRVVNAINDEIYHLDKICNDWAQWNDSYDFIKSLSQDYIEGNLLYETFKNNDLNLIFYFNNDGTVVWGQAYDLEEEDAENIDFLKNGRLDPSHRLISLEYSEAEGEKKKTGVIDTPQGPLMFVSRPILRSDGSGPSMGILTMGRLINQPMTDSLKNQTRIDFEIDYPLTDEKIKDIKDVKTTYVEKDLVFYTLDQDQFTDVWSFYEDVYGDPLFSICYRFPREITKQGLASLWYALLLFIVAGLFISFLLILRLQHNFIRPLQRLTDHALRFENQEDYSARLDLDRRDEIGTLAKSFDIMMQTINERTEDLKTANEKLMQLSQVDGLTGIANRRMFDEFIAKEWRRMARNKSPLSLILADVDYFKQYNDTYGHQMGDECLTQVAGVISKSIHRPDDLGARYGGEEFAVILPDTDEKGAFFIAEKIRKTVIDLNAEQKGADVNPSVTISLGLCTITPQHGDEISDFIRNADHALYFAKETGRNRTVIFSQLPDKFPGRG